MTTASHKVRYIGAIDEVDVVILGRPMKRGDVVEDVPTEIYKALLDQPDNFESADKKKG